MKSILASTAALVMISTVASSAADLATKEPMLAPAPIYTWTGFYVGGNVGGGMATSHFDDPCYYCSSATPTSGYFTGGAQIGYNYQFGNGLVGLEADVNGNSHFKSSVIGGDNTAAMTVQSNMDVSGTLRARGGLVVNNVLLYATGGLAWGNVDQTGTEFCNHVSTNCSLYNFGNPPRIIAAGAPTGTTANASGVLWGSVIGAGIEFALGPNWVVGGEFLHTVYRDRDATILIPSGLNACTGGGFNQINGANCSVRNQLSTDVARLRFSYKFN